MCVFHKICSSIHISSFLVFRSVKGFVLVGEKKIFIYVADIIYYNIMAFMVCVFQNLFSLLCGFVFFTVLFTEHNREEF
jgi:hypothetical protein